MATKTFLCNEVQKRMGASMAMTGSTFMEMGYANGYVAVSPDHPLYGVDYEKVYDLVGDIDVWGGLTFSDRVENFVPSERNIEMIDGGKFSDVPKDWWMFGFDTMHFNDGPEHDREWCISETRQLQQQLEAIKKKED